VHVAFQVEIDEGAKLARAA